VDQRTTRSQAQAIAGQRTACPPAGASADSNGQMALLAEFAPVIRHMAHRLAFRLPPPLDVEDLIHAGVIGLMDAAGKYDPSREVLFKTYAEFRIRGSMLDEIRRVDWVPRTVHEKSLLLQRTHEDLQKRLGRPATEEEMAEALHLAPSEYLHVLDQAKSVSVVSLEDFGIGEGRALADSIADSHAENPLLSLLSHDARDRLVAAIDALPNRERQVITLYYHEDLTMKEVGLVLGLTESRICQIHTQAILRLKGRLGSREACAF